MIPPLLGCLCGHGGCVSTKPRKQLHPANPDMSTHTSFQESGGLNSAAIHREGETAADSWFRAHS